MPPIPNSDRRSSPGTDRRMDPLIAELYLTRDPWECAPTGNEVRLLGRYRLTVFERPRGSGWYSFCIARETSVVYSPRPYPSEGEAKYEAEQAARSFNRDRP